MANRVIAAEVREIDPYVDTNVSKLNALSAFVNKF